MYNIARGTQSTIDNIPIIDGQELITTDTNRIYMDNTEDRLSYEGSKNIISYTYLITDEISFDNWYNNVDGYDYTNIAIVGDIPNTTSAIKEVNLTNTNTKVVIGYNGNGNKIEPSLYNVKLTYDSIPSNECHMLNIRIKNTLDVCFNNCVNMTNCKGINRLYSTAFFNCCYLLGCVGYGAVTFRCCNYLTNCIGSAYSLLSDTDVFSKCNYLNNCICDRVEYYDVGFRRAFYRCNNMNNCLATGGTYTQCFSMLNCSGNRRDVANVYEQSYASSTAISTYACADTPNGGWNH